MFWRIAWHRLEYLKGYAYQRLKTNVLEYSVLILAPRTLKTVTHWLDRQRSLWERRLDRLDAYLKENPE